MDLATKKLKVLKGAIDGNVEVMENIIGREGGKNPFADGILEAYRQMKRIADKFVMEVENDNNKTEQ